MRMTGLILWLAAASVYAGVEIPEELKFLEPVLANEESVIREIRTFERAQKAAADLEIESAREANRAGKSEDARAKQAAAQQRFQLVRRAYELALSYHNDSARLHNYYGELQYDVFGDFPSAVKEWSLASMLDDKLSGPLNNLALHYFHSGNYAMGLEHLDKALELDPRNPDYLFNLAQVYLIHTPQIAELRDWTPKKVYKKAMTASRKAAKLAPNDYETVVDYAVNFFAAERYGVRVNWRRAAKAWQTARPLARNETETFYTWLNEARVWIAAKKDEKALSCLNVALKLHPESEVVQELLRRVREGTASANL